MSGIKKIKITYKGYKDFVYERWKDLFGDSDLAFKSIAIIAILLFGIYCIYLTVMNGWGNVFYYPENTYLKLETEAERMIKYKDWETKYKYTITDYDSETHYLQMELSDKNENVSVTVTVDDYSKNNPVVSCKRLYKSAKTKVAWCIVCMIVAPIILAFCIYFSFLVIIAVILFFVFIIRKVFSLDKKEEVVDMQEDQQNEDL